MRLRMVHTYVFEDGEERWYVTEPQPLYVTEKAENAEDALRWIIEDHERDLDGRGTSAADMIRRMNKTYAVAVIDLDEVPVHRWTPEDTK